MARFKYGVCSKGLHDLTVPGSRLSSGACRECQRAYMQVWNATPGRRAREKVRQVSPERKAYKRAYHAAHREEIAARKRIYHAAHREEILARQRAYYAAHREEYRAYGAAYSRSPAGRIASALYRSNRRLRAHGLA